jgi:glycosyltransferase involved in cell wall biosynthesis
MRILLVNAHGADPASGGAELYVNDLASGMTERGHQVRVLSAFPQRGEPGVETHVLHRSDWRDDRLRRLRNHVGDVVSAPWPRLREFLRATGPELVHTNNLPGIGTGIWEAARRAGIPLVHTVHDYHLLCPRTTLTRRDGSPCSPSPLLCGARTRRLARWGRAVGAVIGVSEHVLRAHRDLFPAANKHIVHHPLISLVDPQAKPPQTPPRTLGYMGGLRPVKGIALLLAAAPALAELGMTLRVAGDGPLRREVEATDHIHYAGWLRGEKLAAFVGSCDAGLVPSLWDEPGPLTASEWLGSGRPVLATQRGNLIEMARRGGVLPFDDSVDGLVGAARRIRDPGLWHSLLATLPAVDTAADTRRWLDEHAAAYESAAEGMARAAA